MGRNIFVGRQPIFDQRGSIFAYELLHRNSEKNEFPNVPPEQATMELLINTFLNIGMHDVGNHAKVFINFNDQLLYWDGVSQLNTRYVVIELLEDVEITRSLLVRLKKLKDYGFKIVLDDFLIGRQNNLYDDLYRLTYIIKVDFKNTPVHERREIETIRNKFPHISLLAEKVETKAEYDEAIDKGYQLFQGYYFAKPEIIRGREFTTEHTTYLYLFKLLNDDEPNIDDITNTIKRDVSLSYKILRYINSASFNIPNEIGSIKQAIVMMGLNAVKKWIQPLILYHIGDGSASGREKVLIEQSLVRAKMCELIARQKGIYNAEEYFLLGMFSLLNAIMNQSWDEILSKMSLTEEVTATLCHEDTKMQPVLQLVIALEDVDMEKIASYTKTLGIEQDRLSDLSIQAYQWMTSFNGGTK